MVPIVFIVVLAVNLGVIALATGSSQCEKTAGRRLLGMTASRTGGVATEIQIDQLLKTRQVNRFAWIDTALEDYRFYKFLKTRIVQSAVGISVAMLLASCLGLAVLGFAIAFLFVSVTVVQIAIACGFGYVPYAYISFKRSRRIAAFNAGLPDAIDMMGRALRAGHSMVSAIGTVAEQSVEPVSSEFREVFKQQNFGMPLREALTQMLDHVPSQDLKVLATGILVQKESGGNLAEILDRTATVIRERLRIQGEIRTHTAQGRMTGWILCSLPIVMLIMINIVNPGYSKVLLSTPLGHKLIYLGMFLLMCGVMIIRSIINGIEV